MKSKNNKKSAKKAPATRNFWQKIDNFSKHKLVLGAMLLIVSIVFLTNYSAIYDKKVDLNGDNLYYYSLGQALSQDEGYTNIMFLEKTPHSHFPPGYPYFVSKIINVFSDDIQTVKKANGVLLYLSILTFFFIIFITSSNSILAFCASILMAMHKELLRFATIMMSETLFLFLSLAAILLALLILRKQSGIKRPWIIWLMLGLYGLIVAYMYLVRTMSLALILTLIAWSGLLFIKAWIDKRKADKAADADTALVYKRQYWKSLILCVITIVAVGSAKMSWDHRNHRLGIQNNDYQTIFMKKTNNEDMQGIEDWKARIKSNSSHFIAQWIPEAIYMKAEKNKDEEISTKELVLGLAVLALIIAGCLYLNTGRLCMLFYIGLTVGILILYPEQFGGLRYLTPAIPILIFTALNGLAAIVAGITRLLKIKDATLTLQAVLLLIVTFFYLTPTYSAAQKKYRDDARIKSWTSVPYPSMTNYLNAAIYCGDNLSDTARVMCRKPEIFYFFSKYHPAQMCPLYATPEEVLNTLKSSRIEYLIIDDWFKHAYQTIYPCIRNNPEKFKVIKQFGEVDTLNKRNPTFIMQFNDEWGYHGDIKDGIREGQGVLKLQDGRTYKGSFANNLPNGRGTLYDSLGTKVISGIWKDGAIVSVDKH